MASSEDLVTSVNNISKRLGRERVDRAISYLAAEDRTRFAAICLVYYDHQYEASAKNRQNVSRVSINLDEISHHKAVEILKNLVNC